MRNQSDGWAMRKVALLLSMFTLSLFLGCSAEQQEIKTLLEVKDHRVEVKIDKEITIVPPGTGLKRAFGRRPLEKTIYRDTCTAYSWRELCFLNVQMGNPC